MNKSRVLTKIRRAAPVARGSLDMPSFRIYKLRLGSIALPALSLEVGLGAGGGSGPCEESLSQGTRAQSLRRLRVGWESLAPREHS